MKAIVIFGFLNLFTYKSYYVQFRKYLYAHEKRLLFLFYKQGKVNKKLTTNGMYFDTSYLIGCFIRMFINNYYKTAEINLRFRHL